jgi:hypothetical protein
MGLAGVAAFLFAAVSRRIGLGGALVYAGLAEVTTATVVHAAFMDGARVFDGSRLAAALLATFGLTMLGVVLLLRAAERFGDAPRPFASKKAPLHLLDYVSDLTFLAFALWCAFDLWALTLNGRYRDYQNHRFLLPAVVLLVARIVTLPSNPRRIGLALALELAVLGTGAKGNVAILRAAGSAAIVFALTLTLGAAGILFADGVIHVSQHYYPVTLFQNWQANGLALLSLTFAVRFAASAIVLLGHARRRMGLTRASAVAQ